VIITKNQRKSKRNKERVEIRKSRCIKLNRTHYCIENINIALSLCGVLVVTFYFSKDVIVCLNLYILFLFYFILIYFL